MIFVPDRMMRTICIRVHSGTMSYTTCWQRSRRYVYVIVLGLLMKIEKVLLADVCRKNSHNGTLTVSRQRSIHSFWPIQDFDQWEISRIQQMEVRQRDIPLKFRPYFSALYMVGTSVLNRFLKWSLTLVHRIRKHLWISST